MNAVVGQVLRCTLAQTNDVKNWLEVLPTVDLVTNSLLNRSTGYSTFFVNYGYHPTVPDDLLCGNEMTNNERVGKFCKRINIVWDTSSQKRE